MCYTCIIAFTGGLVGSSNPVQQSSPAIRDGPSSVPTQHVNPLDQQTSNCTPASKLIKPHASSHILLISCGLEHA